MFSATFGITAGFSSISLATKFLNGITSDRSEAMRRFLPPWSENAVLAYLNVDEDGNYRVIDLSNTDPYSYARDVLKAAARGEDPFRAGLNALAELLKPFASPEILGAKTFEALKFLDAAPEGMPVDEKARRVGEIMYEAFEPGSLTTFRRLQDAARNPGRPFQQRLDPEVERLYAATGVRVIEVNSLVGLQFKARDYASDLRQARAEVLRVARRSEPVSDEELFEAQALASSIEERAFERMRADVDAARLLGRTDQEIRRALVNGGLPRGQITELLIGRQFFDLPSLEIQPGDPLAPELRRRRLLLQQRALQERRR